MRAAWMRPALAAILMSATAAALWQWDAAPPPARLTLACFVAALLAWIVLDWDETPVALAAALSLVMAGVMPPERLYATLGNDLIWLLVGGFVMAAALQQSGVADRWVQTALRGARSVSGLVWRLAVLTAATAFVVPSTSARAALLLPFVLALCRALGDARITRALCLLVPSVILLSAGASLLGAGAHLVAVEALRRLGLPAPGPLEWALLAAPYSLACCVVATLVVAWGLLRPEERRRALPVATAQSGPMTASQRRIVGVFALALAAWFGSGYLAIEPTLVALLAALACGTPAISGLRLKALIEKVEWNLLLFLAATLLLGEAMLDSGAASALARVGLDLLGRFGDPGPATVLALVIGIALLSHLAITSRTARVVVLIPAVAIPLAIDGLQPAALVMATALGTGYCQTLAVSAKPVTLFAQASMPTFGAADLLRLSAALFVPLFALLYLVVTVLWPLQGLRWLR